MQRKSDDPSGAGRLEAQRVFLKGVAGLKAHGELADADYEFFLTQRPREIDAEGRVVLEHPSAAALAAVDGHALMVRLARLLCDQGYAKGLGHKVARTRGSTPRPRRRVLYLPSVLASLTLPHGKVPGSEYSRVNGNRKLSLLAPEDPGLPYGVYPRLALMHLTTEALLCGQRTFYVGESANDFLGLMGVQDSGGANGASTRARDQLRRLCMTTFSYHDKSKDAGRNIVLADNWVTWPGNGLQVTLGERFHSLVRSSSVPLDPTIIDGLRRSPLSLDAYAWLTYRVATLERETVIPWRSLEIQFGADYSHPRNFRLKFRKSLKAIQELWIGVETEPLEKGLLVRPCAPSVMSWLERAQAKG